MIEDMISSPCDDFFNRSEHFLKIDVHITVAKSLTVAALVNNEVSVEGESHHLDLAAKSIDLLKEAEKISMKMLLDKALKMSHTWLYNMMFKHYRASVLKS